MKWFHWNKNLSIRLQVNTLKIYITQKIFLFKNSKMFSFFFDSVIRIQVNFFADENESAPPFANNIFSSNEEKIVMDKNDL